MSETVIYRPETLPYGVEVLGLDLRPSRDRIGTASVQFQLAGHTMALHGITLRRARGRNAAMRIEPPAAEETGGAAVYLPPVIWGAIREAVRFRHWHETTHAGHEPWRDR